MYSGGPGRGPKELEKLHVQRGYVVMVANHLAMVKAGVRFSLPAPDSVSIAWPLRQWSESLRREAGHAVGNTCGRVVERSIAPVLKTGGRDISVPWVRIPPLPP
jgi:hypothetical protein